MANGENDCHSQNFEPLFSNYSKTMMLKTKVDIHVFSAIKNYFYDMLSLENIISDIEPNDSNKQEKIWFKSILNLAMILYEIICNTIISSK